MTRNEDAGNEEQYMQGIGEKDDSIGKVTEEQMLKNLQNDVEAFTKAVKNAQDDLDNFLPQLELDKRMWDILEKEGNFRKIKPDYVFEEDEEYWKVQEEKQKFKIRQDKALAEGHLKQLEYILENSKKGLKKSEEKLAKFTNDN